MDFALTETQQEVEGLARKIFKDRVTPAALKALEAGQVGVDLDLWKELGTTGLLGTSIPETFGGSGNGLLELCTLLEEAGAAVAPVPLWSTLACGALPIAQFGTPEQQHKWLPAIAAGEAIIGAGFAEPGGVPFDEPRVSFEGGLLSGVKTAVLAAELAARLVVSARGPQGPVLVLVDPRDAGVTLERQVVTSGEPAARVTFERARGEPLGPLGWTLARATTALCALELGVAGRALRMTAEYTAQRKQFDRPIATFQAVAQRAGDAYIDVESIRVTLWQAAWLLAEGRDADARTAVAVAKLMAAEAGHRVVYAAQHLHGGIGFDRDYPLHRYYMWSRQLELTLGSATEHLVRIGAELAQEGRR